MGIRHTPVKAIGDPDELFHHGVLGQKWGTRNGPPYPLKPGQHSASEKKAGWQKSLSGGKVYGSTEKEPAARRKDADILKLLDQKNLDYKRVKEIEEETMARRKTVSDAIGIISPATAAIPVAAAIANPAYAPIAAVGVASSAINFSKLVSNNSALAREQKAIDSRSKKHLAKDTKSGLYLKSARDKKMSMLDDAKVVNPGYGLLAADVGTKNNCVLCSVTYDMRRRGYDVYAQRTPYGRRIENTVLNWYKGSKQESISLGRTKDADGINEKLQTSMKSLPDGSRGVLTMKGDFGIAHAVAFEKHDGRVQVIDAQNGKELDVGDVMSKQSSPKLDYVRLDNCTPDYDAIREGAVK